MLARARRDLSRRERSLQTSLHRYVKPSDNISIGGIPGYTIREMQLRRCFLSAREDQDVRRRRHHSKSRFRNIRGMGPGLPFGLDCHFLRLGFGLVICGTGDAKFLGLKKTAKVIPTMAEAY